VDLPGLLDDIEAMVTCESPSEDREAVARSAEVVSAIGHRRLGAWPDRIARDGRPHLRWKFGDGPARVLLLGHHDTVWPLGSLVTHPYEKSDLIVRGPGCFDMKAGVALALHAVAALPDRAGVTILITADEEVGSPTSRDLIEQEAAGCVAALVLEASADGGALKTERKGNSIYRVRITGRAAHAGLEPEAGINSTVELAHQVLAVSTLADPRLGTTVVPTRTTAGSTVNTIPAAGEFAVDVRVRSLAEQQRVDRAMRALRPVLPGAAIEIEGGPNRPPLEESASAELFARAAKVAERLDLPSPTRAAVGGASDGNFTAGIGVPTLDGLGAVGGGAHADHEHVVVPELAPRFALIAGLMTDLLGAAL
jgi:glutamate carboxypeptidase